MKPGAPYAGFTCGLSDFSTRGTLHVVLVCDRAKTSVFDRREFDRFGIESSGPRNSNFFGDDVGSAIGAAEETIGFVVADDLFRGGIEREGAAEAIGSVGQMHQCC